MQTVKSIRLPKTEFAFVWMAYVQPNLTLSVIYIEFYFALIAALCLTLFLCNITFGDGTHRWLVVLNASVLLGGVWLISDMRRQTRSVLRGRIVPTRGLPTSLAIYHRLITILWITTCTATAALSLCARNEYGDWSVSALISAIALVTTPIVLVPGVAKALGAIAPASVHHARGLAVLGWIRRGLSCWQPLWTPLNRSFFWETYGWGSLCLLVAQSTGTTIGRCWLAELPRWGGETSIAHLFLVTAMATLVTIWLRTPDALQWRFRLAPAGRQRLGQSIAIRTFTYLGTLTAAGLGGYAFLVSAGVFGLPRRVCLFPSILSLPIFLTDATLVVVLATLLRGLIRRSWILLLTVPATFLLAAVVVYFDRNFHWWQLPMGATYCLVAWVLILFSIHLTNRVWARVDLNNFSRHQNPLQPDLFLHWR